MSREEVMGAVCGLAGLATGLYFGLAPVVRGLNSDSISSSDAGLAFGIAGAFTGVVFASWGVIYMLDRRSS